MSCPFLAKKSTPFPMCSSVDSFDCCFVTSLMTLRWEGRYKKGVASNSRTIYGSCYGKTYREVKEKLEDCKRKMPQSLGCKKLFGTYCDEWLVVNQNNVKESTFVKYSTAIKNHIKPFFGGYQPEMITTELTAEFVNHLIEVKILSTKTVKDLTVLLKSILKYVASSRKIDLIEIATPKYTAKQIRVLSKEEQQRFIGYLSADLDSPKFGVLFALMTGLRLGEVCALRVKDISLKEKTVTVRETMQRIKNLDNDGRKTKIVFTKPKSSTSARVVPLTNMAYELCKERLRKYAMNAFLLTGSETKTIEPRVMQYHIKKYSAACGIEDMHFHVLRHTFATRCVEVGFEIKSLSEVLGHSTPRITLERYVHSSLEFKRQNMTKLEAIGL